MPVPFFVVWLAHLNVPLFLLFFTPFLRFPFQTARTRGMGVYWSYFRDFLNFKISLSKHHSCALEQSVSFSLESLSFLSFNFIALFNTFISTQFYLFCEVLEVNLLRSWVATLSESTKGFPYRGCELPQLKFLIPLSQFPLAFHFLFWCIVTFFHSARLPDCIRIWYKEVFAWILGEGDIVVVFSSCLAYMYIW